MTFEEAIAAPGKLVQVWSDEVIDGQRIQMIYRLGEDGAKQLAWRRVAVDRSAEVYADLYARNILVAHYDFHCDFVWVNCPEHLEVYDSKSKIFSAAGDYATITDGTVLPRSDIASIFSFANPDYIWRGVKAILRSGQEVPLVTEAAGSAMGDPTYSRNELLMETGWAPIIAAAIATWAAVAFDDRI